MSINRGMDKEDTHTHTHIWTLAIKNEIMPFPATWMKPEFHSEWEKPYDIPYMRNLKRNDANKLIYKTESQI